MKKAVTQNKANLSPKNAQRIVIICFLKKYSSIFGFQEASQKSTKSFVISNIIFCISSPLRNTRCCRPPAPSKKFILPWKMLCRDI